MAVPAEVESLITDAPVSAHLGTTVDNRPHVAPVWYGYRDGVLYFMTGGKKLDNIRRNPRVAVSIEQANGGDVAWNVTLLGKATVREEPDRIEWASEWIYEKYESEETGRDDDGADEPEVDAGEIPDGGAEYALIEVTVGSTAWHVYE